MRVLGILILLAVAFTVVERPLAALPSSIPVIRQVIHMHWQLGRASWYGPGFFHRFRADGKRYHKNDVFAASHSLPLGTVISVKNLNNRRGIDRLVVADRMPSTHGREFDFSARAAEMLGMQNVGVIPVAYQVIKP